MSDLGHDLTQTPAPGLTGALAHCPDFSFIQHLTFTLYIYGLPVEDHRSVFPPASSAPAPSSALALIPSVLSPAFMKL